MNKKQENSGFTRIQFIKGAFFRVLKYGFVFLFLGCLSCGVKKDPIPMEKVLKTKGMNRNASQKKGN